MEGVEVSGELMDEVLWPVSLAGDKGFWRDLDRRPFAGSGIDPVIPSKIANEEGEDRPVAFDEEAYRKRNIIEPINRLAKREPPNPDSF